MEPLNPNNSGEQKPTEFKPGETISPATHDTGRAAETTVPEPTTQPIAVNSTPAATAALAPVQSDPEPVIPAERSPIAPHNPFIPQTAARTVTAPSQLVEAEDGITWTASEFIAHNKAASWYAMLAAAAIITAAIIFLLTRDKITTVVVIVAALAFGFYGARQPRELQYGLSLAGLSIGPRYFPYETFRSFSVIDEGALASIVFMPLKRFGQSITVYFDPQDEDAIMDLLADRLPMEEGHHDVIDRFVKRIRF